MAIDGRLVDCHFGALDATLRKEDPSGIPPGISPKGLFNDHACK